MIENLFTFVRTLGNQRIQGKKFFVTQVGLLGTVSDNSGSIGTAGKVLSSTGSGVSWITVGTGSSDVATLNDLTDVVISTAAEGNLLRFNGTSWVNWAPNFLTGYGSLNDLSDVTLTLPVNGSRLVYVSSTGQWIDAAPLAFGKMYYGSALGDAATTSVITNGTKLSIGTATFSTNLNVGQVDITTGIAGQGSIHIGAIQDGSTYLLASNNKIQVGSQTEMIAPGDPGEEPTLAFTFTPSTLNIQPLGGNTVFGGYTTATGYKTPAGNRQELLTAAGTKTLTNSASNGQILRWIQPVGGVGNWQADDENTASTPNLDAVTDVGSTTTNSITVGNLSTSGTVTAAVVTTPLIERQGVLTINSEEPIDQGDPNPNLLYVSWYGDNKFVINADGYAIANTGYKVTGGTASGFLKANGTIDTSTYLTSYTETQTLDAVTDLGSTTTNNISVGGLTSTSVSTPILQSNSGILIIDADVSGGIEPQQGGAAETILSFDWQGDSQGYIDTDGKITFNGFKTPAGTASGFLKANGTVDTSAYITEIEYLDDIGDVDIVNPDEGDVLRFDGTIWSNSLLPDYVSKVQHTVKAGVAITKGQVVYVTSANGTNMIVGLASNATEATSSKTMGLAVSNAAINGHLFVVTEGLIDGLDTSTATAGDPVWLGVNGALIFGLTNKPYAPAHLVYIGVVTRSNNRNGEIFVHIQNGFELKELHDVLINGVTTGQLIRRDADGLWKNWTPTFLTENSVNVLTNKRINLSTSIASIVAIDGIDPFIGQTDIALYQDGIDRGGRIDVDLEGNISISNPGIGYYYGLVNTEGGTRFSVTVSGNTLTGTVAEFNEAITDGNLVTEAYVQSQIANLVDSAPSTLDTLNELAAALGDDANFATTVTTSIATKQPQLNGTGFVKASGTTISYDNSTYITSESDPVFTGSAAYGITNENLSEWSQAYRWGDHSTFGYLTSLPAHNHSASEITSGTLSTNRLPQQELGVSIVGNFGQWQVHSSYTNFNTPVSYWGWNYVQGSTNAPHQTSSQWYRGRFSLGSEYGFGSDGGDYWMEIAIPRYNQDNNAGNLFVRTAEDGIVSAWQGVRGAYATNAAYATASGNSETTDQTVFSTLFINDAAVATEAFVTSQGYINGESDPVFIGSVAYTITSENITNWDTAFSWGNHADYGYLTTLPDHNHDDRYYTESESDTKFYLATNPSDYQTTTGTVAKIASGDISNLNTAWKEPGASIANGFVVYRYNSNATNQPVVADNANWLINIYSHPAEGEASYGHQLAAANGNNIYFRSVSNGTFSGWHKFWSTNDFSSATFDNWDAAYNNTITAASFATATGILTLTQQDLGTVTVNLDGRYLTSASDSQTLSWDKPSITLSISNGNSIALEGLATEEFVTSQGYITGYTETDTLDTVLSRGASTTRTAEFYQTSNTFINTVAAGNRGLTVFQNTAGADAYITFHISGDYAGYFGLGGAENDLVWGGWSVGNARHRILHSGNFTDNSADWNAAYDWGNHSIVGYLTALPAHSHTIGDITGLQTALDGKLSTSGKAADSELIDGIDSSSILWGNARGTNDSVTTDADGLDKTGFYTSSGFVTRPEGVGDWMYIQHIKLYNDNSQYQKQIGYDTYDDRMWVRTKSANTWSSWKAILTSENIGSYALTSLPAHNHDDRYYTETESDSRYVNTSGDTMTGDITLKYSGADTDDYSALTFSAGGDDYIIKASSSRGVFGRSSYGWHVNSSSAFGVYSSGWVKLFGVEGDTGNTQVFGNLTVSGTITEQSSIRYKENVKFIPSVSKKIEQLDAVSYNKIGSNQEEIGLIAEDVAELFPEVVKYDNEGRPDGVNYSRLSVILLKAVQELTERVNKLENK